VDFDEAADELYGVSPEDFVVTRDGLAAAARSGGDAELSRRIAALRRPTLSAWALNLLARESPEEIASLLEVGSGLRRAWSAGTDLGEWERRRNRVVAAAVGKAAERAERAGHPLREPARREVEETLQAAMVDPGVAEEVRAGRLTRPRSHVGFGVPGGSGREPAPRPPARRKHAEDPRVRVRRLKVKAAEATQAADALENARAEWQDALEVAQRDLDGIEETESRLRRELEELRQRGKAAGKRLEIARREHDNAARSAAAARHHANEAQRHLEEARDLAEGR
jgi:hypothetical protein